MKGHFVLRGPRERKEGGGEKSPTVDNIDPQNQTHPQGQTHQAGPSSYLTSIDLDQQQGPEPRVLGETQNQTDTLGQMPDVSLGELEHPIPDTSLVDVISRGWDSIDIVEAIRNKFMDDPFFKHIVECPKEFKNFEITQDGLVYLKQQGRRLVCILKVMVNGRNVREIVISEAHSLLAHLGAGKTLDYLQDQVWWKDMVSDTRTYCETCETCKRSKPANHKPHMVY